MVGAALMVAAAGNRGQPRHLGCRAGRSQGHLHRHHRQRAEREIYYLGTEPPSRAAFDADSSQYLTNIKVNVNPAAPWVFETTLNDPNQWAIVSASGVLRTNPAFHCEIAVDGVVVVTQDGGSGVQCALRPW